MKIQKGECYPYLLDWKDYVDENTTVIIDSDQLAYVSAAANESRTIEVTHKASGNKKEFKTRTEFWGNKKNSLGGWLQDTNLQREVKGQTLFTKEDFEIIDIQTAQPLEYCLSNIKSKLNHILDHLGLTQYKCILGGKNNFRLKLQAPNQYKSNRDDTLRPLQLKDAREYIIKHHKGVVVDNVEADDLLAIYGRATYDSFKETGKFKYVVVSFDKDNLTMPTFLFNNYSEEGKLKHPIPMLVDEDIGTLFLDKNKVKGYGFKFKCFQLIYGDPSDGIQPYQNFKIRFGETSAYKLIQPCKTKQECLQVVVDKYKEWFPEGVKFTNWDNTEVSLTTGQWLNIIYRMTHMLQSKQDKSTIFSLVKELGVKV